MYSKKFSLIVATRNRPVELRRLFSTLIEQEFKNFEVIVIDQSDEQIKLINCELVNESIELLDIKYRHSSEVGLSKARNVGLNIAAAEIIAFPDDDCWYGSKILSYANELLENNKNCSYISGQYSEPNVVNSSFSQVERKLHGIYAIDGCSSVTLFIRQSKVKELLLRFDENLGAGTALPIGEETDFMLRLSLAGAIGIYEPRLVIFHKISKPGINIEFKCLCEKSIGYIFGKNCKNIIVVNRAILGVIKLAVKVFLKKATFKMLKYRIDGLIFGAISH